MADLERGCPLTQVIEENSPVHQAPCLRPTTLTPGFQHLAENGNCGGDPICPWLIEWVKSINTYSFPITITDLHAEKDTTLVTGAANFDLSQIHTELWNPLLSTQTVPISIQSGDVEFGKFNPQYQGGSEKPDDHPYLSTLYQIIHDDKQLFEMFHIYPNNPPDETPGV